MDLPAQMVLYAQVVDAGSLSAAARGLNQSPSAVSKQISHLEDRIGVRLLQRSKKGISLTEEGTLFYERCAVIAREVNEAKELVASLNDHPTGILRVTATVAFAKAQILPILPGFLEKYPEVQFWAKFTDQKVDLAQDRIDVAVWFTEQITDESLIARKVAHNSRVICAAPSYLERFGTPETTGDLKDHNCMRLNGIARLDDWNLGTTSAPDPSLLGGNFSANSADAIYHATLAGIGISRLSNYIVAKDIAAGRLVRLLPEYEDHLSDIFAVYAAGRNLSPKVRAFIDHLVGAFSPIPPWEA